MSSPTNPPEVENSLRDEIEKIMRNRVKVLLSKTESFIIEILQEALDNLVTEKFNKINEKCLALEQSVTALSGNGGNTTTDEAIKEAVDAAIQKLQEQHNKETEKLKEQLICLEWKLSQVKGHVDGLQAVGDDRQERQQAEMRNNKTSITTLVENQEDLFQTLKAFEKDIKALKILLEKMDLEIANEPSCGLNSTELVGASLNESLASKDYSLGINSKVDLRMELLCLEENKRKEGAGVHWKFDKLGTELNLMKSKCESLTDSYQHLQVQVRKMNDRLEEHTHQEVLLVEDSDAAYEFYKKFPSGASFFNTQCNLDDKIYKNLLCPKIKKCYASQIENLKSEKLPAPFQVAVGNDLILITEYYRYHLDSDIYATCYKAPEICKSFHVILGLEFFEQHHTQMTITNKDIKFQHAKYPLRECFYNSI